MVRKVRWSLTRGCGRLTWNLYPPFQTKLAGRWVWCFGHSIGTLKGQLGWRKVALGPQAMVPGIVPLAHTCLSTWGGGTGSATVFTMVDLRIIAGAVDGVIRQRVQARRPDADREEMISRVAWAARRRVDQLKVGWTGVVAEREPSVFRRSG